MIKILAQETAIKKTAKVWPLFLQQVKLGLSERQVSRLLRRLLLSEGLDRRAFPFIVAASEQAAEPHHVPNGRVLQAGDSIKIDFGVTYESWKTDITRTVFLGKPSAEQKALYTLVLRAQERAAQKLRPGIPARDIDDICRGVIAKAGFGKFFIHSTGHGVGRAIHEPPYLTPSRRGNRLLAVGDVVTIEPGIYIKDKIGIRIEDMYEITATGARDLSAGIPKDLNSNVLI
ncbi:MAG: M24 family metallopeptidase [Candidatus Nomurabacteria bacterium]|nr:MAG: M24 family metallopeptidase [Candidatus Nomurabacteria bacterium]